jgi:hypothetical protein
MTPALSTHPHRNSGQHIDISLNPFSMDGSSVCGEIGRRRFQGKIKRLPSGGGFAKTSDYLYFYDLRVNRKGLEGEEGRCKTAFKQPSQATIT